MGTVGVPDMQQQPITYQKAWVALTQVALDCCISTMLVLIAVDYPGFEEVLSGGVETGVNNMSLCPINGMASTNSVHVLLELWGISRSGTTSLLRYFIPVSTDQKLPDPQGALADMPSSAISAASTVVKVSHGLRTLGNFQSSLRQIFQIVLRHLALDCTTPSNKHRAHR